MDGRRCRGLRCGNSIMASSDVRRAMAPPLFVMIGGGRGAECDDSTAGPTGLFIGCGCGVRRLLCRGVDTNITVGVSVGPSALPPAISMSEPTPEDEMDEIRTWGMSSGVRGADGDSSTSSSGLTATFMLRELISIQSVTSATSAMVRAEQKTIDVAGMAQNAKWIGANHHAGSEKEKAPRSRSTPPTKLTVTTSSSTLNSLTSRVRKDLGRGNGDADGETNMSSTTWPHAPPGERERPTTCTNTMPRAITKAIRRVAARCDESRTRGIISAKSIEHVAETAAAMVVACERTLTLVRDTSRSVVAMTSKILSRNMDPIVSNSQRMLISAGEGSWSGETSSWCR
eukprot:PhM_4_TR13304/c0_g1_i1/m.77152